MIEDAVRSAGYLTLGTRLKRLGERLQAQTQRILDAHELFIPASQFPFLFALHRLGPLTVGEVAEAVGVTQPAATRTVAQLADLGLVDVAQTQEDQRRKSIELTTTGKGLVDRARRGAWPAVERAVRDLCEDAEGTLLEQLTTIEEALSARPLEARASKGGKGRR